MMKRLFPFYMLAFSLWSLYAATAVPNAASNYIFTTPLRPAHIRGLVMGSPPAYYVPRSEDFDWLYEAYRERSCYRWGNPSASTNTTLSAEFGKWGMAETNRFYRWVTAVDAAGVTNVVVGFNIVTNPTSTAGSPRAEIGDSTWLPGKAAADFWNPTGASSYLYGYLDPDVSLVTGALAYNDGVTWTNIYTLAGYTNAWTNAFSTLTMPMTNGTVSVYTNRWSDYRHLPAEFVYTNVVEADGFHFCKAGEGPFPGHTNAPPLGLSFGTALFDVPAVISNDYVALRGAVRLADAVSFATNYPKRVTSVECSRESVYTNDVYESESLIVPTALTTIRTSVTTNSANEWLHYVMFLEHREWDAIVQYKAVNAWGDVVTNSTERTESVISGNEDGLHSDTAVFETRFPSDLVTAGGDLRVEVEAVFADVGFLYEYRDMETYDRIVAIDTNVLVRLDGPMLDVTGANAVVKVLLDSRAICDEAATAAGAPRLPTVTEGDPGVGRSESWFMYRRAYYLFYRTVPNSRLSDW